MLIDWLITEDKYFQLFFNDLTIPYNICVLLYKHMLITTLKRIMALLLGLIGVFAPHKCH